MNLDPRSWRLNSEMGVVVESEGLAADVLAAVERDLRPENAWRVTLDDNGEMIWTAGDEVLHRQPARNFWQRVEDVFFMLLPKEVYVEAWPVLPRGNLRFERSSAGSVRSVERGVGKEGVSTGK